MSLFNPSFVFWIYLGGYSWHMNNGILSPRRLDVLGVGCILVHKVWYTRLCRRLKYDEGVIWERQHMMLYLRDQFVLANKPWKLQIVSLWGWSVVWMISWCAVLLISSWRSVILFYWSDHICWRHHDFGFFLRLVSACSSVFSYFSVLNIFLFAVYFFPYSRMILLADDYLRCSYLVLVIFIWVGALFPVIFWMPFFPFLCWFLVDVYFLLSALASCYPVVFVVLCVCISCTWFLFSIGWWGWCWLLSAVIVLLWMATSGIVIIV